jgi:hypothetical protein
VYINVVGDLLQIHMGKCFSTGVNIYLVRMQRQVTAMIQKFQNDFSNFNQSSCILPTTKSRKQTQLECTSAHPNDNSCEASLQLDNLKRKLSWLIIGMCRCAFKLGLLARLCSRKNT